MATASRRRTNPDGRMPLAEHLRELRRRVILVAVGIVVAAVVGWVFYPWIFSTLQQPLTSLRAEHGEIVGLNFDGVGTPLDIKVKVSLAVGVALSSPWWIYQLWAFVTPGLTRGERRYTVAFLGAAVPLFLAGMALAWLMLPTATSVLITEFTPAGAFNLVPVGTYLWFVIGLMLVFGVAFLLPVVMVALSFLGFVTSATWLRGWRWAVMLAFVFAAVATPTGDAVTMITLAVPICGLYFAAVGVAKLREVTVARRERGLG